MRKLKPYVYKKHATRTVQEFWDVKHKCYSCLSFVKFLAKRQSVLIIDHEGRDITETVLNQ